MAEGAKGLRVQGPRVPGGVRGKAPAMLRSAARLGQGQFRKFAGQDVVAEVHAELVGDAIFPVSHADFVFRLLFGAVTFEEGDADADAGQGGEGGPGVGGGLGHGGDGHGAVLGAVRAGAVEQGDGDEAFSVAGGGETLASLAKYGVADKISYISTGGGVFLEFLEGKKLPAVEILEQRAAKQ